MAFFTSDQSPLAEAGQALYLSGSQVFASTNAATVFTLSLGALLAAGGSSSQAQPAIFDAKAATIVIANNGTSQTLNAASLQFTDAMVAGTQTATISYTIPGVSIANNANGTFVAQLSSGVLKNLNLQVTFASAPTAGSIAVFVVLHQTGVPVALNVDLGTLITAAGVTTTQSSGDQNNINYRGVICVINMATVGTGSVTPTLQGKDSASGNYYTIAAGSAQITNVTTFLALYPGASTAAPSGSTNVAGVLPVKWRIQGVANNANATTYTITAVYIL